MRHVFVITYGRSGSTILLRLLNAIDGYCIRGESNGIIGSLATSVHKLRQAHEKFGNGDRGKEPSDPWYGIADVNPNAWAAALAEAFSREVLRPPPDARASGFKDIRFTPRHLDEEAFDATIAFLSRSFENARLIFNTRDWREVARSGWWRDYRRSEVRKIITASDERFRDAVARLGHQAFLIDFSEYVGNPDGFNPLLGWLGESIAPRTLLDITERRLQHMKGSGRRKILHRLRSALR
jgi:hypothetical protein